MGQAQALGAGTLCQLTLNPLLSVGRELLASRGARVHFVPSPSGTVGKPGDGELLQAAESRLWSAGAETG